jgi:hypothetical protein
VRGAGSVPVAAAGHHRGQDLPDFGNAVEGGEHLRARSGCARAQLVGVAFDRVTRVR